MSAQIFSKTNCNAAQKAEADFRLSRIYRGLLASSGFAALLLVTAPALAATAPANGLGTASTYGIVSSTMTNTANDVGLLTRVTGDACNTTPSALALKTITGAYATGAAGCNGAHATMGTDITSALADLNAAGQGCISLGAAVDLINTPGHATGVYTPGCYSSTGNMTVGSGTVTLNGAGVYIFKSGGTLTNATLTNVAVAGGACANSVFWVPTGATSLSTNTTFVGSIVDGIANAITLGSGTTIVGRLLSHGGTVTTTVNDITVPTCTTLYPVPTLSQWAMITFALLIVGFGVYMQRRRRQA